MNVVVTITEYQNHLKALGYAWNTVEIYRKNLGQFKKYLTAQGVDDLRKVTRETIQDYQAVVMAEKNAMETRALKLRPVKRLFEHLIKTNRLLINPTEGLIETCRKNRKIGATLTVKEVKKLMAQPNLSLPIHIRNRAIMEMLYATGIRVDELVHVKVHDVDLKDKVLLVRKGKWNKQRVTPLGRNAAAYVKEYLTRIRPWYAKKNPKERTLFLKNTGEPLHPDNIRDFLRRYRNAAGIKKPASPHTFRRTCATHLLQEGADIRYIQKLLGHKNLRTTQTYTKVLSVEVKKTHNKTHPGIRSQESGVRKQETEERGQRKGGG